MKNEVPGCLLWLGLLAIWIFGAPVLIMLSWNLTMPLLFGLPTIGYWTAFFLGLLSGLLFKGIPPQYLNPKA